MLPAAPLELPDFLNRVWNEFLSPEPRVHTHDQHVVYYFQHVVQLRHRCRGVDHYPRQRAFLTNHLKCPVEIPAGYGLDTNRSRTRLDKDRGEEIRILNHQVVIQLKARDASNA